MRLHTLEHGVKVVGIHFDKFAILKFGQGLLGLAGEVAEYAGHKRQLLEFDGSADLYVIGNLDAWGTHAV
jgi:hypothetical protein